MIYTWKVNFFFVIDLLSNKHQYNKYWQSCFNAVFSTPKNIRWLNFPFSTKYQRLNNIGSLTLNQRNSFKVVLTLFCQRWNNVDKHTSAQFSFSTKFHCWNNVGSSALNRRNSINIVSRLFCQRWNNVVKCTSAHLLKQRWWMLTINVVATLIQRWCVCWVILNMFCMVF